MATYHQEGRTVQNQYNAEVINFGIARTSVEFLPRYLLVLSPLPEPLKILGRISSRGHSIRLAWRWARDTHIN